MEPQNQEQILNTNPQIPKSKKKIWLIVGALVVLLLAGGGYYYYKSNNQNINMNNSVNKKSSIKTYTDSANNFSVDYPDSWVIGKFKENLGAAGVIAGGYPLDEKNDDIQVTNLVVFKNDKFGQKLKDDPVGTLTVGFVDRIPESLANAGAKDIKNTKALFGPLKTDSGLDYYGTEFSSVSEHGPLRNVQYSILADGNLFILIFNSKEADYNVNLPIFEGMVKSFKTMK